MKQLEFQKCLKFIPFPQLVLGLLKPTPLQVCPAGYELFSELHRQEAGLGLCLEGESRLQE